MVSPSYCCGGVAPGRQTTGSRPTYGAGRAPDVAPTPPAAGRGRVLGPGARYAVSRVLSSIGTLLFVIVFNFFLFRMLPGDPIALYTRGRDVDPEISAPGARRSSTPRCAEQFVEYIKNPFAPDLPSQKFSQPVWDVIARVSWPTLLLVGTATILATIFGVWLGIRSAWKRGERFDKVATNTTLVLYSMPEFWFGMILLIVFSVGVFGLPGIFPVGGLSIDPASTPAARPGWLDTAWHLVLPVDDPHRHLPRRVLAGHARLAHRRDGAGLPADRARQGPARRRGAAPARGTQRHAADDHADLPQPRLRRRRGDHDRVRVLASPASAR